MLNDACEAIEVKIKECGGMFNIKMAPKVVTATDEADLAKQMERAEMETAEVRRDKISLVESLVVINRLTLDESFNYRRPNFLIIYRHHKTSYLTFWYNTCQSRVK